MAWWDSITDWFSGDDTESALDQKGYYVDEMDWNEYEYDKDSEMFDEGFFTSEDSIGSISLLDMERPQAQEQKQDSGYFGALKDVVKDNPGATKALVSLLGGYFASKRAEDLSEEEYMRQQELMKLKASLSKGGGGSGPPAATTTTNKGPGALKRKG